MQGAQGHAEHRHIQLGAIIGAQAGRQHLDKTNPGTTVHGLTNGRPRDQGRHAVVHQTGHHIGREMR